MSNPGFHSAVFGRVGGEMSLNGGRAADVLFWSTIDDTDLGPPDRGDILTSTFREKLLDRIDPEYRDDARQLVEGPLATFAREYHQRPRATPVVKGQGETLALTDPEPWPEPVEGSTLAEEIRAMIRRYVAMPEEAATAISLWILHTHAFSIARVSPILAITSPEKQCGKTNTLNVVGELVPRALPAANITPSAMFRAIQQSRPTLLIDEADTFITEKNPE